MLATLALLLPQGASVEAGPDLAVAATGEVQLAGSLTGGAPLAWLTADGNGPSEDMLIRYDDQAGEVAVGLLASSTQVYGWLGDLVEIDGVLVGNSVLGRELFTVDRATGACTHLSGPFDAKYGDVHSLAYDAAGDRLFAVDLVERELLRIDYLAGTATPVGTRTLKNYPLIRALAYDPGAGRLLAIDQHTDALIAIHPATGAPTHLATVAPFPGVRQEELQFVGGALYMNLGLDYAGVMDGAQLQRVDPARGDTVDVGPELTQVSGHALFVESLPERTAWRQVSGPGTVSFDDPGALAPLVSVDRPGTYELVLEAFDLNGVLVASDTLALTATGWESFCSGDGSGAACPCGNWGGAGEGCANSTGLGGQLALLGGTSVALDDAVLEAGQLPAAKAGLFLTGPFAKNGGLGTPFGDGLRCVQGPPLKRYPLQTSSAGVMTQPSAIGLAAGAIGPGSTWLFQAWYRDDDSACGARNNLTNAIAVTFGP